MNEVYFEAAEKCGTFVRACDMQVGEFPIFDAEADEIWKSLYDKKLLKGWINYIIRVRVKAIFYINIYQSNSNFLTESSK